MKSRLEKVYSKLPNQKVNLKAQKVALGVADDLGDEISEIEKSLVSDEEFENSVIEFNNKQNELVKQIQEMESTRDELEQKGQEILNKNNDIFNRVESLLDNAKNAANELGINPETISNYIKADSLIGELVIANITRDLEENIYF
jgi:glycerate-2-kinase